MRKNGCVNVGNTEMFYAAFGNGSRKMIVLPGLSDGLATVKGKAWILASSYKDFCPYVIWLRVLSFSVLAIVLRFPASSASDLKHSRNCSSHPPLLPLYNDGRLPAKDQPHNTPA